MPNLPSAILAPETLAKFGYDPASLTPGANKHVVCRCSSCSAVFDRVRKNVKDPAVCKSCGHLGQKSGPSAGVYPVPSCVDTEATLARFGYAADRVSPHSSKTVVCVCDICRKAFTRSRGRIQTPNLCSSCVRAPAAKQALVALIDAGVVDPPEEGLGTNAHVSVTCRKCSDKFTRRVINMNDDPLCRSCIRTQYFFDKLDAPVTINPAINDALTLKIYGYTGTELHPGSDKLVSVNCTKCQKAFHRVRNNVTDEPLCGTCSTGAAQRELSMLIQSWVGTPVEDELRLPSGKRLDVYIPALKIGIEYNGLHWHHERSKQPRLKDYHADKMRECASVGIRLITIFEDEWLLRPLQARNFLKAQLGACAERVGARECSLREIPLDLAREFFELNHIQGAAQLSVKAWGLAVGDELVAALSLGRHHRQNHEDLLVLDRLCFKSGLAVAGGSSRLFKAARKYAQEQGVKSIVSWSDNRWSTGTVYMRMGFTLAEELPPDYAYVDTQKPTHRISKQSQRKQTSKCPEGLTELEWATHRGLARIWDCGKKRWEFKL